MTFVLRFVQAGAKHVYGIECSAIANQAKQIVQDNGYADKVTIIQGKVGVQRSHPRPWGLWCLAYTSALPPCVGYSRRSRRSRCLLTRLTSSSLSGWATSCFTRACLTQSCMPGVQATRWQQRQLCCSCGVLLSKGIC